MTISGKGINRGGERGAVPPPILLKGGMFEGGIKYYLQGNWTVCVPYKYPISQIFLIGAPRGGGIKKWCFAQI